MNCKTETISVTCPCCGQTRQMAVKIPYQDHIQTPEEILDELESEVKELERLVRLAEEEYEHEL